MVQPRLKPLGSFMKKSCFTDFNGIASSSREQGLHWTWQIKWWFCDYETGNRQCKLSNPISRHRNLRTNCSAFPISFSRVQFITNTTKGQQSWSSKSTLPSKRSTPGVDTRERARILLRLYVKKVWPLAMWQGGSKEIERSFLSRAQCDHGLPKNEDSKIVYVLNLCFKIFI